MPSRSKAELQESDEDSKHFNWDGNGLNRHPWVKHLAKRAYKHDPRFRQHVEFGFHMLGHKTINQSVEHSTNLFDRNVSRSTWEDPACLGYWKFASGATTVNMIPAD
jgi:hypothetical protein